MMSEIEEKILKRSVNDAGNWGKDLGAQHHWCLELEEKIFERSISDNRKSKIRSENLHQWRLKIEEKILEQRGINDVTVQKLKIRSRAKGQWCSKSEKKILERSIHDVRKFKRNSSVVASMMFETLKCRSYPGSN